MKKIIILILFILIPINVNALDIFKINDNNISNKINDDNENTYVKINKDDVINISSDEDIYGIYIIYELSSKTGILKIDDKEIKVGSNNFLHEYINTSKEAKITHNLTLTYNEDVKIGEIYLIKEDTLPSYVEVWDTPCKLADLLLFSTHSDDEQLFFLGLLPTYVARGASVQVVYFTNHNDNPKRLHEQLHGLYTVGIRNYPIIGIIPDAWSESLNGALNNLKKANLDEDDALKFEVENIRRFKPLVIIGHDELGEYSHGQHILNTYILKKAIISANDENYDIDSYNTYGLWDTPKLYLHLYKENEITMDYDTPLEYFDGLTAYEVSKKGYAKHISQQYTWFTGWMNGKHNEYTKSTDIKTYSPNSFGLYRSLVGVDINKNDMLENLTIRSEQVEDTDILDDTKDVIISNKKEDNNKKYYTLGLSGLCLLCLIILVVLIKVLTKKKK